ncbi:hypothetical protein KIPB_002344 [Kipferlia bialata]|uniref:Uncharacterized protein n=1 Tax=Kipferlia bialata TaxID=797122 RepID=A0A391NPL7_9EUKA|nr:hypothetical protein KIPB_002344 [Kipferlia bialata]|eukprot:g2344.t1
MFGAGPYNPATRAAPASPHGDGFQGAFPPSPGQAVAYSQQPSSQENSHPCSQVVTPVFTGPHMATGCAVSSLPSSPGRTPGHSPSPSPSHSPRRRLTKLSSLRNEPESVRSHHPYPTDTAAMQRETQRERERVGLRARARGRVIAAKRRESIHRYY